MRLCDDPHTAVEAMGRAEATKRTAPSAAVSGGGRGGRVAQQSRRRSGEVDKVAARRGARASTVPATNQKKICQTYQERSCSECLQPIEEGDHWKHVLTMHDGCGRKKQSSEYYLKKTSHEGQFQELRKHKRV